MTRYVHSVLMRNLLRTLLISVAAIALLAAGVSLALATGTTSTSTTSPATSTVYPCPPTTTTKTSTTTTSDCVPCPPEAETPNQGTDGYVLTVDNPNVPTAANQGVCKCENPQPLTKVEGNNLGSTIVVSASKPIDFVTIKSGEGVYVISAVWQIYSGTITLSKDVSNYVIWVCP